MEEEYFNLRERDIIIKALEYTKRNISSKGILCICNMVKGYIFYQNPNEANELVNKFIDWFTLQRFDIEIIYNIIWQEGLHIDNVLKQDRYKYLWFPLNKEYISKRIEIIDRAIKMLIY